MTKSIEDDFLNGVRKNNIYSDNTKDNIEKFYMSLASFASVDEKNPYLPTVLCDKVKFLPNGLINLSLCIQIPMSTNESLHSKVSPHLFYKSFNVVVVEEEELTTIGKIRLTNFQTKIENINKKYVETINHKKPYEIYTVPGTEEKYYKFILMDNSIRLFPVNLTRIKN